MMTDQKFSDYEKIYFRNLQILQEKKPDLIPYLNRAFSEQDIQIFSTHDPVPTISYQGRLFHSKRHPLREADKFCRSNNVQSQDFIVLYGYGLGYHVQALADQLKEGGFLYVIECNHDILKAAFMLADQSGVINKDNVFIITGSNDMDIAKKLDYEVFWALENIEEEKKKILFFHPSLNAIPRRFSRIKDIFDLFSFQKRARYVLGEQMIENLKENIPALMDSYTAFSLYGQMNDVPAFLVGAGPGLDNTISIIKKYAGKAVILAVDSACLPLYRAGIIPDFVVSVDPKRESSFNFSDLPELENLIVIPSSCREVVRFPHRRLFTIVQETGLIHDICGDLWDTKGLTRAGGSVSCIMFDVAARMGLNPLILAGMDYGFPGWRFYAARTPEHKKMVGSVTRFNSMETISYHSIRSQKLLFLENASGTPVPTYQSLYSYARNMEELIKEYDDKDVYNLFSEGVYLQGSKNIFFEEELDELFSNTIDVEHYLRQARNDDILPEKREALIEISRKNLSEFEL